MSYSKTFHKFSCLLLPYTNSSLRPVHTQKCMKNHYEKKKVNLNQLLNPYNLKSKIVSFCWKEMNFMLFKLLVIEKCKSQQIMFILIKTLLVETVF